MFRNGDKDLNSICEMNNPRFAAPEESGMALDGFKGRNQYVGATATRVSAFSSSVSDLIKGHWMEPVKESVCRNNGKMVPSNMTNEFQPLDLTVNRSCKAYLRKETNTWFSDQVQSQIQNGVTPEKVQVDLRISVLKPLHAEWVKAIGHRRLLTIAAAREGGGSICIDFYDFERCYIL